MRYVEDHPNVLSEVIPYEPRRLIVCWRNRIVFVSLIMMFVTGIYLLVAPVQQLTILESVVTILLAGALIGAFGVMVMLPSIAAERIRLPIAYEVSDGVITIRSPLFKGHVRLAECQWSVFEPSRWSMSVEAHLVSGSGLLLYHRSRRGFPFVSRHVCGVTPEMREIWSGVFRLANIDRVAP